MRRWVRRVVEPAETIPVSTKKHANAITEVSEDVRYDQLQVNPEMKKKKKEIDFNPIKR